MGRILVELVLCVARCVYKYLSHVHCCVCLMPVRVYTVFSLVPLCLVSAVPVSLSVFVCVSLCPCLYGVSL